MTRAEIAIADYYVTHQVDLFRLEAHTRETILGLLNKMGGELENILKDKDLSVFSKGRLRELVREAAVVVDDYYTKMSTMAGETMTGVAKASANTVLNVLDGASLPTENMLRSIASDAVVFGTPADDWWDRQSGDTLFRFTAEVRQGMMAGDTTAEIVSRVVGTQIDPGLLETSRRNAEALVRSSIMSVANDARVSTYKQNGDVLGGMMQLSTLDGRTSDVCIAYAGAMWDMEEEPINGNDLPFDGGCPRHWNCRSTIVPIVDDLGALGFSLGSDVVASEDGPVSEGTSFDDWLSRRTPEQQNAQLGKGRAELWRSGKITLTELLNLRGNPLSLAQLERKYGG